MKAKAIVVFAIVLCCSLMWAQSAPNEKASGASASAFKPVHEYDPARDAAKDIDAAVKEAGKSGKRVLVEIGGKWCVWCTYMDKFFAESAVLRQFRDDNFVMVKVNFSPENKNEKVIAKYGKVSGYPHIFVLDEKGQLLHSQESTKLERGRGYSPEAMAAFLKEWAPKKG